MKKLEFHELNNQTVIFNKIIAKQAEITALIEQLQALNPDLPAVKNKHRKLSAIELLNKWGITGQVADDFIVLKKSKKAPITETVLYRMTKQCALAKISIQEAAEICIERNWQGFKAEWYQQPVNKPATSKFFDGLNSQEF